MQVSLFNSERFQKEYKEFQEKISKIENITVKENATVLLKKLVAEIKALDTTHQEMFGSNQPSTSLGESRSRVTDVRRQLERLLKDAQS
jgi:predicted TIM-barrel fold metal-dependent hydrolase